jgi:hypothetical protein
MELESRKALLVREILTDVNDEDTLQRLNTFFQRMKNSGNNVGAMPSSLLSDLMDVAGQEDKAGLCISSDELEKDIATW